ncbi:gem-associated protein 5 [Pholidichthys leucotaenia]
MRERSLPASPNWYCSRCSDVSSSGVLGVGAKNVVYLIQVSAAGCRVTGELVGHKDVVSGFSFCQHAGQSHFCVSSSVDGGIRFWDSNAKAVLWESAAHQNPVSVVHWSPADKNLVVSGDEKGVVVCHWFNTRDAVRLFPEPRSVVCLSCSPHSWKHVAVGYKDGMILLIDVSQKGQVVHRLRGHDDDIHSLAWSPLACEEPFYARAEDAEGTACENSAAAEEKGCYIVSGSKDQTVRIWSSAKGRGVMTLKLPFLKRRSSAVEHGVKERLWISVDWPKGRPTQIVSSCFGGELLLWDLTQAGKHKWTQFAAASDSQNHSRIVFNTSSALLQDGRELLFSTSMDREIKCWDLTSLTCCWTLPTLGGFVYALTFSPVGTGTLALGVGDGTIRVWNTLSAQNQYDTRLFWQSIKSKVTALAWHPKKEGLLSFGTDDGKVGVVDVFSNKLPQISSSYHKKTVYTLDWGPPVPPMSFGGAEAKPSHSLYSCGGEGVILQHDVARLSGEASDIDRPIRDTNSIKHKLSPHTDFSWKQDGRVVAIGNEDGSIDVYQAPSLKLLCSIQQHHKIINALRWHHDDHQSPPELRCLLASGSSNAIVYVHNLCSVIENPPESPVTLTEPYRRLCGHTAKITSMAWSPHHSGRLVTASYDGTSQVWDVLEEVAISNYRGHAGHLLCVDWSPVDPDVVWSGGKDSTVQEWSVSRQEFTQPPKGKKMVELKEKRKSSSKKKKKSGVPGEGGEQQEEEAAPTETNGETVMAREKEPEVLGEGEEDEVSSTSSSAPSLATLEMQRKPSTAVKMKTKPDLNMLKKRKPRSMLPLSTSMSHRPKEELLQDCVTLASFTHNSAPPVGCVPGQGDFIHLGLFSDRQALYCMFDAEEEAHLEAGHFDSVVYLRLWSGDLEGVLQLATEKGELNDHLLSIAPMAGFEVWRRTVEAFVKQLCLQEQHLKAASYLLSINKIYEAVELLRSHKLYREAIALVKARLPSDEPILKELYSCWADILENDGHLSAAAKCHLATGASFDAAKVIAKKNDIPSLRTAASLAGISGEAALAQSLSLRCAKELAAARDWRGAQEVLSSQDGLLAHRLHFCVAELLSMMFDDPEADMPTPPSPGQQHVSFLEHVRATWRERYGVSEESGGHCSIDVLLKELKAVASPSPSANVPLKQVILYSSLHVSRAALSWFADGGRSAAAEVLTALLWIRETGVFSVSAEFCRLLFPDGDISVCSRKQSEVSDHTCEEAQAAICLQAFVHYYCLYECWWNQNGGSRKPDFDPSPLLSEPHAACQAAQRSVREVQEQLGVLVLQHGRVQAQQLRPGHEPDHETPEVHDNGELSERQKPADEEQSSETLLSLSTKMSKFQKELSDLPTTLKAFPHPDVTECCLLLLHLSKSSPLSVPDSVQQRAKDLLRKYGTSPSLLRASRRFVVMSDSPEPVNS